MRDALTWKVGRLDGDAGTSPSCIGSPGRNLNRAAGPHVRPLERTPVDPAPHLVLFERAEADGKQHSKWVLRAEVVERPGGSTLHMHLHYGGGLWTGGVLERVLADQITNGRGRLAALVSSTR